MNHLEASSRHLELPAERFYWAVLDASVMDRPLVARRQLGYLFEHVLPLPIDDVQAVYRRLPGADRQYVACGMERQALERQIDQGGDLVALTPVKFPDLVLAASPESGLHPRQFNLLVDDYEPRRLRRARRRWVATMLLLLALAGALAILGLSRRTAALHERGEDLRQQQWTIYEELFGAQQLAELPAGLTPERLLTAEVRQLRRTRSDLPGDLGPADAGTALAGLLSVWPGELQVQAESIVVSQGSVEVRAVLDTGDHVQQLSDALDRLEEWNLQPLETRAVDDGVRAMLRFTPSAERGDQEGAGARDRAG